MKTIRNISVLTFLLIATSIQGFALVRIADVSKERAKELGVTIRSHLNGEAGVEVWLEFKTHGELKNFMHVDLQIMAAGKSLVHAPLLTERPTADGVSVNFSTDPSYLDTSELTIVVKNGERTMIGYQFKLKDFIEREKPR